MREGSDRIGRRSRRRFSPSTLIGVAGAEAAVAAGMAGTASGRAIPLVGVVAAGGAAAAVVAAVRRRGSDDTDQALGASLLGAALVSEDGRLLRVNRALLQLAGHPGDWPLGRTLDDLLDVESAAGLRALLAEPVPTPRLVPLHIVGEAGPLQVEVDAVVTEGPRGRLLHLRLRDLSGDARERAVLEAQMLRDALTGLPNRALLNDRLITALERRQREGTPVAVLLLDLDRFKLVNDSLGHRAGDELLQTVATRLQDAARPGDVVARLGGDEFVVLCEGAGAEVEARRVAERVIDVLRQPVRLRELEMTPGTSVGIAVAAARLPGRVDYCVRSTEPEDLLREADVAMYRAKARGGNTVAVFDEELRDGALERLRTEMTLRQGLRNSQLLLHYQPVVDLMTGRWVGLEALVRWDHPEHGLLAPETFIAVAEETDLIAELGTFVIGRACRDLSLLRRAVPAAGDLRVAINASVRQLGRPDFADAVLERAADHGISPGDLALEITETLLMRDGDRAASSEVAVAQLHGLRARGVRILVDDFGTGFSSLSYLRHLPVDAVKVDRSFVSGVGEALQDAAIVTAIVDLAAALGLAVVAEGIETEEQRTALRLLGCASGQGYLFGRPMPIAEVAARLAPPPAPPASTRVTAISARGRPMPWAAGSQAAVAGSDERTVRMKPPFASA